MIKTILKNTRAPALILMSVGLLVGCAEIKSGMNDIKDSISGLSAEDSDEQATASAKSEGTRQDGKENKSQKLAFQCPDIKIIDELRTMHKFKDMNPPENNNRISTARLTSLNHECRITDEGGGQIDLYMTFESATGPASQDKKGISQEIGYPYFVAVTDKQGKILSKDVFELSITPSSNTGVITARENIRQSIPVENPRELGQYSIAIGFQMSDAQLEYNRKHASDGKIDKPTSIAPEPSNRPAEDAHKQIRNLRE